MKALMAIALVAASTSALAVGADGEEAVDARTRACSDVGRPD